MSNFVLDQIEIKRLETLLRQKFTEEELDRAREDGEEILAPTKNGDVIPLKIARIRFPRGVTTEFFDPNIRRKERLSDPGFDFTDLTDDLLDDQERVELETHLRIEECVSHGLGWMVGRSGEESDANTHFIRSGWGGTRG